MTPVEIAPKQPQSSEPDEDKDTRIVQHNNLERKRRLDMKNQFAQLKKTIDDRSRTTSKIALICKSTCLVEDLTTLGTSFEINQGLLLEENHKLRKKVSRLRGSLFYDHGWTKQQLDTLLLNETGFSRVPDHIPNSTPDMFYSRMSENDNTESDQRVTTERSSSERSSLDEEYVPHSSKKKSESKHVSASSTSSNTKGTSTTLGESSELKSVLNVSAVSESSSSLNYHCASSNLQSLSHHHASESLQSLNHKPATESSLNDFKEESGIPVSVRIPTVVVRRTTPQEAEMKRRKAMKICADAAAQAVDLESRSKREKLRQASLEASNSAVEWQKMSSVDNKIILKKRKSRGKKAANNDVILLRTQPLSPLQPLSHTSDDIQNQEEINDSDHRNTPQFDAKSATKQHDRVSTLLCDEDVLEEPWNPLPPSSQIEPGEIMNSKNAELRTNSVEQKDSNSANELPFNLEKEMEVEVSDVRRVITPEPIGMPEPVVPGGVRPANDDFNIPQLHDNTQEKLMLGEDDIVTISLSQDWLDAEGDSTPF